MPKQVTNVAADDALTTIYRLSNDEGEEVKASTMAERLGNRPASVAGMLSRLSRDNLVKIDNKKRITLTEEGFERAQLVVRRNRLAECMLVEIMGLVLLMTAWDNRCCWSRHWSRDRWSSIQFNFCVNQKI